MIYCANNVTPEIKFCIISGAIAQWHRQYTIIPTHSNGVALVKVNWPSLIVSITRPIRSSTRVVISEEFITTLYYYLHEKVNAI